MGHQIEKRYLVKEIPRIAGKNKGIALKFGWLSAEPQGTEIKLSQYGERHFMTVNQSSEKSKKLEIKVSDKQFEDLWKGTKGRRVRLRMFEVKESGTIIILYKFIGKHKGLITAQVKFTNEEKAINFKMPKWLGKDITGDKKFDFKNVATQ
jgi:CYTH domain-containing protein